jgi:hypothetical protein
MNSEIRAQYNHQFCPSGYQAFLDDIAAKYDYRPPFRIAETPVFIPNYLKDKLIQACRDIYTQIRTPEFLAASKGAIQNPKLRVPGDEKHSTFLQMDFGICLNEWGEMTPQLIETQGFPSLYFFQVLLSQAYKKHFDIPDFLSANYGGMSSTEYIELLRRVIVGDSQPENVVLLEIEPQKQATYIDFLAAADLLGIKVLCLSELKKRGRNLYYRNEQGEEVAVHKIFNRVIFDELEQRQDLETEFSFQDEVDVEWIGHPNWFYRISKHSLPLLHSPYIPESYFLDQLDKFPEDLDNYVLKPLFSFAGAGVRLDFDANDLRALPNPENYILQRKVAYHPVVQTLGEPAKCEIRMLMIWENEEEEPKIVNNLVRLSKGRMIGVRYNRDKDWVGASVGYFDTRVVEEPVPVLADREMMAVM